MAYVGDEVAAVANQTHKIALELGHIENGHTGLTTVTRDLSFSLRALVNHVQSELQTINTTMADIRYGASGHSTFWGVSALVSSPWISYLPWLMLCLPGGLRTSLTLTIYSIKLFLSFPIAYLLGRLFARLKIG
ncbi:hypothetical protein FA13DRAFT_1408061 [Coprinellus micaceus]|uniref:Uncharacterized protein n=1 Tax=Coprinellus micaceus TaxID=71717 RepID=A0A4Y7SP24_COPMI|nr:hypothetical protein FA13DRAFT_1408061 [Coprinellus micaceus]